MAGTTGAADAGNFKQALFHKIKGSGFINDAKSKLRVQLLNELRRRATAPGSSPRKITNIQEQALNTLVAEYLASAHCTCSLSVFLPESGLEGAPPMSNSDVLQILNVSHPAPHAQLPDQENSPAHSINALPSVPVPSLLSAFVAHLARASGRRSVVDSGTMTTERGCDAVSMQIAQLEESYLRRRDLDAGRRGSTLTEQLSEIQRQCEERYRAQLQLQVERVREIEVGQARLDEAAKWRREIAAERRELERLYSERVRRLREQEEALVTRVREQARGIDVEAHRQRQRLLQEDERLRAWQQERESDLQARLKGAEAREAALEAREKRLADIEADCARRVDVAVARAEHAEAVARAKAELDLSDQRAALREEVSEFEAARSRAAASEETAAAATARVLEKDAQLEAALAVKAQAEERAAELAAREEARDAQIARLMRQLEALKEELAVRGGLALRSGSWRGGSAEGGLEGEAEMVEMVRGEVGAMVREREEALRELAEVRARLERSEQGREEIAKVAVDAHSKVQHLARGLQETQALLDEANDGRERALVQAEDCRIALRAAEAELRDALTAVVPPPPPRAAARGFATPAAARSVAARSERAAPSKPAHAFPPASLPDTSLHSASILHTSSAHSTPTPSVTARLSDLEREEAELQEQYKAFQSKLQRQQAHLREDLNRAFSRASLPVIERPLLPTPSLHAASFLDPAVSRQDGPPADPDGGLRVHLGALASALSSDILARTLVLRSPPGAGAPANAPASPQLVQGAAPSPAPAVKPLPPGSAVEAETAPCAGHFSTAAAQVGESATGTAIHAAQGTERSAAAAVRVLGEDLGDTMMLVDLAGQTYSVPVGALSSLGSDSAPDISVAAIQRYVDYKRLTGSADTGPSAAVHAFAHPRGVDRDGVGGPRAAQSALSLQPSHAVAAPDAATPAAARPAPTVSGAPTPPLPQLESLQRPPADESPDGVALAAMSSVHAEQSAESDRAAAPEPQVGREAAGVASLPAASLSTDASLSSASAVHAADTCSHTAAEPSVGRIERSRDGASSFPTAMPVPAPAASAPLPLPALPASSMPEQAPAAATFTSAGAADDAIAWLGESQVIQEHGNVEALAHDSDDAGEEDNGRGLNAGAPAGSGELDGMQHSMEDLLERFGMSGTQSDVRGGTLSVIREVSTVSDSAVRSDTARGPSSGGGVPAAVRDWSAEGAAERPWDGSVALGETQLSSEDPQGVQGAEGVAVARDGAGGARTSVSDSFAEPGAAAGGSGSAQHVPGGDQSPLSEAAESSVSAAGSGAKVGGGFAQQEEALPSGAADRAAAALPGLSLSDDTESEGVIGDIESLSEDSQSGMQLYNESDDLDELPDDLEGVDVESVGSDDEFEF